jgi:LytS/YehU family sensor histidine kinase
VVDSENQKTVPLRRELAICEDFIRLEELRGRPIDLQVELTSHDRDVSVPPLTLVTLLENAARHGLRPNEGPLPVFISADRPDSNHLRLRVQQPGTLRRPTDQKNHAGLDLIRRQLQMVLGEEGRLELLEQPPGNVVANLILPT